MNIYTYSPLAYAFVQSYTLMAVVAAFFLNQMPKHRILHESLKTVEPVLNTTDSVLKTAESVLKTPVLVSNSRHFRFYELSASVVRVTDRLHAPRCGASWLKLKNCLHTGYLKLKLGDQNN